MKQIVLFFRQSPQFLFALLCIFVIMGFLIFSAFQNPQPVQILTPTTPVNEQSFSSIFQAKSQLSTGYPQSLVSTSEKIAFISSQSSIWDGNASVEAFINGQVVSTFIGHFGEFIVNTQTGSFFVQDGQVFPYPTNTRFVTPNIHPQFGKQYIFARIDASNISQVRQSTNLNLSNSRDISDEIFIGSISEIHFLLNDSGQLFQLIVDEVDTEKKDIVLQKVGRSLQQVQVFNNVLAWQSSNQWLVINTPSDLFSVPYKTQLFSLNKEVLTETVAFQTQLNERQIFGNMFADRCDILNDFLVCVVKINGSSRFEISARDALVSFNLQTNNLVFLDDSKVFSASALRIIDEKSIDFVSQFHNKIFRWEGLNLFTQAQ